MNQQQNRLLAIDPGTKEIGVAVFKEADLIYYGVKTIRDRSTAQRMLVQASDLIKDLVAAYQPQFFAIERMFVVQKSAALLCVLADEMKTTARGYGLPIFEYFPSVIRKELCNSGKATKRDVAEMVAARYRELGRFLNSQTSWEEKYYANIFDAVAVGLRARIDVLKQPLPF